MKQCKHTKKPPGNREEYAWLMKEIDNRFIDEAHSELLENMERVG
jgi:hypothetical protein